MKPKIEDIKIPKDRIKASRIERYCQKHFELII